MYTGGFDARKNVEGLIEAYGLLDVALRSRFQLAVVCGVTESERLRMAARIRAAGLGDGDVVFTGFVSEGDLVGLYNCCDLFVFPSLHEGFGLPALEAMSCGAPTIAGDNSSLAEVVGRADALFEARRPQSIAAKLNEALVNEPFRSSLRRHGLGQAATFSWRQTATRALEAIHAAQPRVAEPNHARLAPRAGARPRLAFVSPLPPFKTGVARYSAEVVRELSRYYDVNVVTDQSEIADPWIEANCRRWSVEEFAESSETCDRILYQVGNSEYHQHMPDLLQEHPGVVVLHDYFLSGLKSRMAEDRPGGFFLRQLVECDGYEALATFAEQGRLRAIADHPMNADVVERAVGVIAHSPRMIAQLEQRFGLRPGQDAHFIPHLRAVAPSRRGDARAVIGLDRETTLVCAFGRIGSTKLNLVLLEAFARSGLAKDRGRRLAFVGEADPAAGAEIENAIAALGLSGRASVTGFVSPERYQDYLAAADVAVQLRTESRGESSGAVLDCLAHGLPTIVNRHGSMNDLAASAALFISDPVEVPELVVALDHLSGDEASRRRLAAHAKAEIAEHHAPERIGRAYFEAIERSYRSSDRATWLNALQRTRQATIEAAHGAGPLREDDYVRVASHLAGNRRPRHTKLLYLDVGELAAGEEPVSDAVTGAIAAALRSPPPNWRVEPVRIAHEEDWTGCRYARRFAATLLDIPPDGFMDDVLEPRVEDVFVCDASRALDAPLLLRAWRRLGVKLCFRVASDQLAEDLAESDGALPSAAALADGLICSSEADCIALGRWLARRQPVRARPLRYGWAENGGASVDGLDLALGDRWPFVWSGLADAQAV
jgi:glycosyltransferase involved in cell wall biosynthesis